MGLYMSLYRKIFVISLLLVIYPLSGQTAVYKWVDENGNTHFGDTPPANAKAEEVTVRPNVPQNASPYSSSNIEELNRKLERLRDRGQPESEEQQNKSGSENQNQDKQSENNQNEKKFKVVKSSRQERNSQSSSNGRKGQSASPSSRRGQSTSPSERKASSRRY